ncbi:MAG: hypothetical protein MZW92_66140 [Comamonadaceae bacterium]|nr:hypothetical protein [Comamonadaceae bacterium]
MNGMRWVPCDAYRMNYDIEGRRRDPRRDRDVPRVLGRRRRAGHPSWPRATVALNGLIERENTRVDEPRPDTPCRPGPARRAPVCRKGRLLPGTTHREFRPKGQLVRGGTPGIGVRHLRPADHPLRGTRREPPPPGRPQGPVRRPAARRGDRRLAPALRADAAGRRPEDLRQGQDRLLPLRERSDLPRRQYDAAADATPSSGPTC